jgi:DNA helicase-2/ATP-dependent DNA helicase PcrA
MSFMGTDRIDDICLRSRSRRIRTGRRRRSFDSNRWWVGGKVSLLLEIVAAMVAVSVMIRRNPGSILKIRWGVHGLSSTTRRVSVPSSSFYTYSDNYDCGASVFQRRSMATDNNKNRNTNYRRHPNNPRTRWHPLATAFVTPPQISGSEDDGNFFESGVDEWREDIYDQSPAPAADKQFLLKDLNPSQIEAVTQPLVLENEYSGSSSPAVITRVIAGPGSGKTKVLTTRIAYLLREDTYGRVLAVTFTRKAAGEMKERLEKLLREQEKAVMEVQEEKHHHDNDDESIGYGEDVVQETARNPGTVDTEESTNPGGIERVELGTFHSICAKILRFNGDLLRNLPSVKRDMSQAQPVWVEKLSPPSSSNGNSSDEESPTPDEPEMVLVDPEINLNGQYAIVDQAEQIRILNECLKEKEIDLKQTDLKPMQILTAISNMKEIFARNEDPFADRRSNNGKLRGAGAALRMARKIYYPYREKLLTNNAVDFDDLILLTRELLAEDEELRERLHRRWPHVLVDEYQDTSKIQMDLIKLLTSSSLFVVGDADQSIYSWRGAHVGSLEDVSTEFEDYGTVRTVFLKENYRSTSNIVKAAEKVISSGPPPSVLGKALSDAGVTEEERQKIEGTQIETKKDDLRRAMKPKRGSGPSPRVVACEDERAEAQFVVDTILNMTAHGDIGPTDTVAMIYRTNAQSRYLEEACVKQNLPYVIRGGAGGFYKRAEIRDCLCFLKWLHNGNDEGSMVRAMKTPSKGIGEKAFREFKEYCDLVKSYFRQNAPGETPTCLDILISMTNAEEGEEGVNESAGTDFLLPEGTPRPKDHITKRALNNFLKFSAKMRSIRSRARDDNIGKLLFFITEELELVAHFDAISKSKSEFLERKENVQELRNAAKKYASYGPALGVAPPGTNDDSVLGVESALSSFLDDVALVSDNAEANNENNGEGPPRMVANLMTIHASKGTEFDCVFVVGLEEGTLPCNPALQEGDGSVQLEEEKRLCYVAMTRAKTRLVLTWRKEVTSFFNWSDSGPKTQAKQRSRFLNAIVSKKTLKKNSKKKMSGSLTTKKASGSSRRDFSSARSNRNLPNRSGLLGPKGPGRSPRTLRPERREISSSPASRRVSSRGRMPIPERGQRRQESYASTPSLEGIEALRSRLEEKSPSTFPSAARAERGGNAGVTPSAHRASQNDALDPMWFFPVGKKVVHVNLGKGIVVEPPPFREIEDAKVRVRFDNGGKTLDFPALGSDIVPDTGAF